MNVSAKVALMASSVLTLAWGPAHAQVRPQPEATTIDDVIVTAQRRDQRIQDVPIAVSSFSRDDLQSRQITSLQDLQRISPSLNFRSGQDEESSSITIRGIGTQVFSIGVEPSV